jgi:hypothetical protein
MGVQKKIGIEVEHRRLAQRYASRFHLEDHKVVIGTAAGKRFMYFIGTDRHGITYRIRFDKIHRMRSPKGIQVVNRLDYLIYQSGVVHGVDKYDFSLVKESDITTNGKLQVICKTHGVFLKRKANLITNGEGCPQCSYNRIINNRKYL